VQGYELLTLPPCNIEAELNNCQEVHGWNATLFYAALYINAFGEGCVCTCLSSLGADQFDREDPSESRQQSNFFNWYTF
jgi:solute carrier family 15 (peptide/histidine transporter), member 3/4